MFFSTTNFIIIIVLLSAFVTGARFVSRWIFAYFHRALFVSESSPFAQGIPSAAGVIFPLNLGNSSCVTCFLWSACVMACVITFVFFGGRSSVLSTSSMIHPNISFLVSHIPSCNNFFLDIPSENTDFFFIRDDSREMLQFFNWICLWYSYEIINMHFY